MFTELSLRCWSSGHRNLYRYQVSSSTVFFFVSYMHIHVPSITYCSRLFVVFQEMTCLHTLNMTLFVESQSYISSPSFMFVSAEVSETHELNQSKKEEEKNSEIGYFQFNAFPGHIIYAFFNQRYLLEHMYRFNFC